MKLFSSGRLLALCPWLLYCFVTALEMRASLGGRAPQLLGSRGSSFVSQFSLLQTTTSSERRVGTATSIVMMPEGPEVRTLVQQLHDGVGQRLVDWRFLSGRYIRHSKPAGWEEFKTTMTQMTEQDINDNEESVDIVLEWKCKGKFIYMLLDNGKQGARVNEDDDFARSIWITLGMTGKFLNHNVWESLPRYQQDEARWYVELCNISTGKRTRIYYYDTRNFGTLKFCLSRGELAAKLESLGPDILDTDTTTAVIFQQIFAATKPTMNICRFLMDQSKIAGIGNYILSESLYRARIDPFCTLADLNKDEQERLFTELQQVAIESFNSQGMTRAKGGQYRAVDGSQGDYAFQLQCYGRNTAANGEVVYKQVNGPHGRTIWYTQEQLSQPRPVGSIATTFSAETVPKERQSSTSLSDPVESLVCHLTDPSWNEALGSVMSSDWFAELAQFVAREREEHQIYPPSEEVFNAFNMCPLAKVKVVIIGQDPYHGYGQGHGLAFSVQKRVKIPPSLVNIFKEAHNDVQIPFPPPHGNLQAWAEQGVLLLNTVLTVRGGRANSHARQGWETFTDAVVDILNQREESLVFLLWGLPAQRKASAVDESKHFIIRTSHPSPLGATKTNSPFLGSRCFSRANNCLKQLGHPPIDWKIL
jgi:uracil-DNA glycosylase/DNA-formamidopyrimidine glycosylase